MPYVIRYAHEVTRHLLVLSTRDQRLVLDTVDRQLSHQPTVITRNRKRMRENPLAPWELRIGNLRVYYDVVDDPEPTVDIVAVGVKSGNEVRIGGQVVQL